ncbi:MAG TPA: cytochrome b/b6 domain-containing protein [Burkholderiales bacterium]|nr:cytochrome b/b6 domain-containing protein [Burkholderiales bacterium]
MRKIPVWDLPLRMFHWLLALLVAVSIVSAEIGGNAMQIHLRSGYTILTLVLFRILWGFFGGTHARFASFVRGPARVIAYLKALRRPNAGHHLGHNPAGGWSVMAMLLVLLIQAGTGLFSNDDIATEGPLAKLVSKAWSDRITGIHEANVVVLYVLIGLHLAAIAFYFFRKRDNLLTPMITGLKDADERGDAAHAPGETPQTAGKTWLAAALLAACAACVYLLIVSA